MKTEQALTVALRLRPMSDSEYRAGAKIVAHTVDNQLVVLLDPNEDPDDILRANRSREKEYVFDCAFSEMANQEDVYENTTKNLIPKILAGYNLTVFAYGPTGTGKTYTMLGTSRDPGIMVLTLNSLFEQIHATKADNIFRVTMSYLEIYNEMIRDLLNPKSGILDLRDGSNGETVVAGLTEVEMMSTQEVMQLLNKGNLLRTCEPTAANRTSSRSHAILKVTVEQRSRTMDVSQEVRTGKLFMVDLAGSERAAVTKNRGQRMVEGAHINRSLLALGNCINALVTGKGHYVNYRDSKLTRLLKDSLGGNCQTVMIAHISPASRSFEESRNTLTYAERAKHIKTRVQQNVHAVSYHITQYHRIIAELRWKISRLEAKQSRCQCQNLKGSMEVDELCHRLLAFLEEQKEIREEIYALKYSLVQNAMEVQRLVTSIGHWEAMLGQSDQPSNERLEGSSSNRMQEVQPLTGSTTSMAIPAEQHEARKDLAVLIADKQRMEAKQKRLERQLTEVESQYDAILQELNKLGKMPQQHHVLPLSSQQLEIQSRALDSGLAAAVGSLTIKHQDRCIQEMQHHFTEAFDLVEKQSEAMKAHGVLLPDIVHDKLQQLKLRQSLLASEISARRHFLPRAPSYLPIIVSTSEKLETMSLLEGSKSNLLQEGDGTTVEDDQTTEITADECEHCLPEVIDSPLVVQGWSSTTTLTGLPATRRFSLSGHKDASLHKSTAVSSISVMAASSFLPPAMSLAGKDKDKSIPMVQMDATKSANCVDEAVEGMDDCSPLHKTIVYSPPRICISRCSTHESKARKSISHHPQQQQQQTKMETFIDTESDNTCSVTSLGVQTRRLHRGKHKYGKDSCPAPKPKLSQSTSNRLKEARARMRIVEPSEESSTSTRYKNHCNSTSHTSPRRAHLKRKASNGLGSSGPSPRRQSMQPTTRPRQSLNRQELIPHRVVAGGSQTVKQPSPYLSSPFKTKKHLNQRPRPSKTKVH